MFSIISLRAEFSSCSFSSRGTRTALQFSGSLKTHISLSSVDLMGCSLSIFVSLSCFAVSQADDDSSQTPPDYTVRPNMKIHNIGEWLRVSEKEQLPDACQYLTAVEKLDLVTDLWERSKPLVDFVILWLGNEYPPVIAGGWVKPLFSSLERCATWVRQWNIQQEWFHLLDSQASVWESKHECKKKGSINYLTKLQFTAAWILFLDIIYMASNYVLITVVIWKPQHANAPKIVFYASFFSVVLNPLVPKSHCWYQVTQPSEVRSPDRKPRPQCAKYSRAKSTQEGGL